MTRPWGGSVNFQEQESLKFLPMNNFLNTCNAPAIALRIKYKQENIKCNMVLTVNCFKSKTNGKTLKTYIQYGSRWKSYNVLQERDS